MHDLNRIVVQKVSTTWEDIAYALEYEISAVEEISEKHTKTFNNWLVTNNGVRPKIWQTLLDKFKEIEELHSNIESITEELIQIDSKQIAS